MTKCASHNRDFSEFHASCACFLNCFFRVSFFAPLLTLAQKILKRLHRSPEPPSPQRPEKGPTHHENEGGWPPEFVHFLKTQYNTFLDQYVPKNMVPLKAPFFDISLARAQGHTFIIGVCVCGTLRALSLAVHKHSWCLTTTYIHKTWMKNGGGDVYSRQGIQVKTSLKRFKKKGANAYR